MSVRHWRRFFCGASKGWQRLLVGGLGRGDEVVLATHDVGHALAGLADRLLEADELLEQVELDQLSIGERAGFGEGGGGLLLGLKRVFGSLFPQGGGGEVHGLRDGLEPTEQWERFFRRAGFARGKFLAELFDLRRKRLLFLDEGVGILFLEGGFLGLLKQADLTGFELLQHTGAVGRIGDQRGNPESFLGEFDRPAGEDGVEFAQGVDRLALTGDRVVLGTGFEAGDGLGHQCLGCAAAARRWAERAASPDQTGGSAGREWPAAEREPGHRATWPGVASTPARASLKSASPSQVASRSCCPEINEVSCSRRSRIRANSEPLRIVNSASRSGRMSGYWAVAASAVLPCPASAATSRMASVILPACAGRGCGG